MKIAVCIPSRDGWLRYDLGKLIETTLREHELHWYITEGVADLCLVRNVTMSRARRCDPDLYLWVDDDMVFDGPTLLALVEYASGTKKPTAARYVARDGAPAFAQIEGLSVAGMGLMVVPAERIPPHVSTFRYMDESCAVWFWGEATVDRTGERIWLGEDYRFCLNMGGVKLMGRAGHRKSVVLWPKGGEQ